MTSRVLCQTWGGFIPTWWRPAALLPGQALLHLGIASVMTRSTCPLVLQARRGIPSRDSSASWYKGFCWRDPSCLARVALRSTDCANSTSKQDRGTASGVPCPREAVQGPVLGQGRQMCTRHMSEGSSILIWIKTHRSVETGEGILRVLSKLVAHGAQVPGLLVKCSFYKAIFGIFERRCFRKGFSSSLMSASKGQEIRLTPHHLLAEMVPNCLERSF